MIGNIADKSFKQIYKSKPYWLVMSFIASGEFDAKTMRGTLCLQHKVNEFLWDLKQGNGNLKQKKDTPPLHVNFI